VGGAGADTLDGGAGDNTYDLDSADTVIRASGMGKQTVQAQVSYALSKSVKIDVLKAASDAGSINLTGNGFGDEIIGNASGNTLKGEGGDDRIFGGKGKDAFVFDTKIGTSNVDTISDFNVKNDSIWLDNAIFMKLGTKGTLDKPAHLKKGSFVVGDKAEDANDYIIYDKASGKLSYDADGSRSGAAVEFARLKPDLALTHKDFFVI
jgi:Ca2+-binding RTX toxin-like protein